MSEKALLVELIDKVKKMGFTTEYLGDGTVKGTLNLKEEEHRSRRVNQKRVQYLPECA